MSDYSKEEGYYEPVSKNKIESKDDLLTPIVDLIKFDEKTPFSFDEFTERLMVYVNKPTCKELLKQMLIYEVPARKNIEAMIKFVFKNINTNQEYIARVKHREIVAYPGNTPLRFIAACADIELTKYFQYGLDVNQSKDLFETYKNPNRTFILRPSQTIIGGVVMVARYTKYEVDEKNNVTKNQQNIQIRYLYNPDTMQYIYYLNGNQYTYYTLSALFEHRWGGVLIRSYNLYTPLPFFIDDVDNLQLTTQEFCDQVLELLGIDESFDSATGPRSIDESFDSATRPRSIDDKKLIARTITIAFAGADNKINREYIIADEEFVKKYGNFVTLKSLLAMV